MFLNFLKLRSVEAVKVGLILQDKVIRIVEEKKI